ncbi:MAG: tetratricopeptide repeat protein [Acidobacteria bacterium]|nr:tetratricopeptide repeat protein [Acidobacteriota bacterium]
MSDPIIKGVKRPASRPNTRGASATSSAKTRKLSAKSARPKPLAKRPTGKKAPVRKAAKAGATSAKAARGATKTAASKRAAAPKKATAPRGKAAKPAKKFPARAASAKQQPRRAAAPAAKAAKSHAAKPVSKQAPKKAAPAPRPAPVPRQPTADEVAALRAFERAHKEFARGRFAEARMLFRQLIEQHAGVAEVTARARTYLAIAEARLRSESSLPRNAEELYDRGVIELNRGEYVAAQEMFERALRREPEAAHIHYGLAATRARLGSVDLALQSLERALQLQPTLRLRAPHDPDLVTLRNDPEYERIVFAPRP